MGRDCEVANVPSQSKKARWSWAYSTLQDYWQSSKGLSEEEIKEILQELTDRSLSVRELKQKRYFSRAIEPLLSRVSGLYFDYNSFYGKLVLFVGNTKSSSRALRLRVCNFREDEVTRNLRTCERDSLIEDDFLLVPSEWEKGWKDSYDLSDEDIQAVYDVIESYKEGVNFVDLMGEPYFSSMFSRVGENVENIYARKVQSQARSSYAQTTTPTYSEPYYPSGQHYPPVQGTIYRGSVPSISGYSSSADGWGSYDYFRRNSNYFLSRRDAALRKRYGSDIFNY